VGEFVEGAGAVVDFHVAFFDFFLAVVEEHFAGVYEALEVVVHVVAAALGLLLHGGEGAAGVFFKPVFDFAAVVSGWGHGQSYSLRKELFVVCCIYRLSQFPRVCAVFRCVSIFVFCKLKLPRSF
jgi:hypothetical protein